jgi:putative phosphoesterase
VGKSGVGFRATSLGKDNTKLGAEHFMKIACLADVHGNLPALEAVFESLPGSIDSIVFLGDVCGYYPYVNECIPLMIENRVTAIRGNHDQVLLDCIDTGHPDESYEAQYGSAIRRCIPNLSPSSIAWMSATPCELLLDWGGTVLHLFHGAPWDPMGGRVYPDFDQWERFNGVSGNVIMLGQTHYSLSKWSHGKFIMNPGSVGQPRDQRGAACYAILDLESHTLEHRRIAFDSSKLIKDACDNDPDIPYLADILLQQ